jgi:GNAT superfamily N-acetyltransferase
MKEIEIEFPEKLEDVGKIQMSRNEWAVGYVKLIRNNNTVTLADIYICDRSTRVFQFLFNLKREKNFRRRGFGSALLAKTIEFCKKQGFEEIKGTAKGDLDILIPWYKKHGFVIDENNRIYLKLHS